ncbi:MAG: 1-acyl-sn-glycerol-3-phosphate acyltransferase [Cyanobacteria bacterium P01_F01_bin.150]
MSQHPLHILSHKGIEQIMVQLNRCQSEVMRTHHLYDENNRQFLQNFSEFIQSGLNSQTPSPGKEHISELPSELPQKDDSLDSDIAFLSEAQLLKFWRPIVGIEHPVAETLYMALYQQFVGNIVLENRADFYRMGNRPRLYLANHQVAIESILFMFAIAPLSGSVINAIAKVEHQQSWINQFLNHLYAYPNSRDPNLIFYFKRDDPRSMFKLLSQIKTAIQTQQHSLLVHVQGTRSLSCRQEVKDLSAVFIDLALDLELPIVPVKFAGGLPIEPLKKRLEFPYGYGQQNYLLGQAIYPGDLRPMDIKERKAHILERLNTLGGAMSGQQPSPADTQFGQGVEEWMAQTNGLEVQAVLYKLMEQRSDSTPDLQALLTVVQDKPAQISPTLPEAWLRAFGQWLRVGPSRA